MKPTYIIQLIDRDTKTIVQEKRTKSEKYADRIWCMAIKNVNPLKYKIKFFMEDTAIMAERKD